MKDSRIRLSKECIEALAVIGIDDAKGVNGFIMGCLKTGFSDKDRCSKEERKESASIARPTGIPTTPGVPKYISINGKYTPEYYRCQRVYQETKVSDGEVYAGPDLGMIPVEEYYASSGISEWVELFRS